MRDERRALRWDSAQVITHVGVNGVLTLGIVDSGSFTTLLDQQMCASLGVPVRVAKGGEFGSFLPAGETALRPYWGIVDGPLVL